jgi:hypothetical protein
MLLTSAIIFHNFTNYFYATQGITTNAHLPRILEWKSSTVPVSSTTFDDLRILDVTHPLNAMTVTSSMLRMCRYHINVSDAFGESSVTLLVSHL